VAPDLQIEGELFGNEGILETDKAYLLQVLSFLSSQSRAPWFIERDSQFSSEIFRLLQQNLTKNAKRLGIVLKDVMFVKEDNSPHTFKIHEGQNAIMEVIIFASIVVYLLLVFGVVNHSFSGEISGEYTAKVSETRPDSKDS